jgi:hypothetical protein
MHKRHLANDLEHFVGREDLIADFVRALHSGGSPRFPLLVYHGEAGQGKSTLRRKLVRDYCKILPDEDWAQIRDLPPTQMLARLADRTRKGVRVPVAVLDFTGTDLRYGQKGPLRLRRQLGRGYPDGQPDRRFTRLRFHRFDLTYAQYWKISEQQKLSVDNNFLPEEAETVAELCEGIVSIATGGLGGGIAKGVTKGGNVVI